jgi:hypothetical protein
VRLPDGGYVAGSGVAERFRGAHRGDAERRTATDRGPTVT